MDTQPLFLDQSPLKHTDVEKHAGVLTPMGDNSDMWQQEVVEAAYKQLPFLSDFDLHAVMDKKSEERGYAIGSLEVKPQSNMAMAEEGQRPLDTIQIPFIIREHHLAPMDVFLDGKQYKHMTEGRVRAALFRPDVFDSARDRPPEPNLYTDLQPPLEASSGAGGGGVKLGSADAEKEAGIQAFKGLIKGVKGAFKAKPQKIIGSRTIDAATRSPTTVIGKSGRKSVSGLAAKTTAGKKTVASKASRLRTPPAGGGRSAANVRGTKVAMVPLLPQLQGRVREGHLTRVKLAMQDPNTYTTYVNADEGVQAAMASALGLAESDPEKTAAAAWDQIPPTVVQLRKTASGGYLMKRANAEMYEPEEQEISEDQLQELIGDLDLRPVLESDGSVTASPDAAVKQTLEAEEIRTVDQPGIWMVQDPTGATLTGWAFPQLMSFSMVPLPLTLFSNGSQYSCQDRVAGRLLAKSGDLPKGTPRGYGALYCLDHGTPKVFEPMTISNSYAGPDGLTYHAGQTDTGEQVSFCFHDSVKTVTQTGEGQFMVPEHCKWLALKGQTDLVSEPMLFTKVAGQRLSATGEILSDGITWTFRGAPFAKLASNKYQFLNRLDAEFLAVAAGMEPGFAKQAMDRSGDGELVVVRGLRTLGNPHEKLAAAKERVIQALNSIDQPIRNYDLIKEAAYLDDALTADKILGLGFLNAENVATFVDMLPGLEYASSKLAEMLFAVRLGLKDVPEVAVERMLVAMEDVIGGLRSLQQKEVTFGES